MIREKIVAVGKFFDSNSGQGKRWAKCRFAAKLDL